MSKVLLSIVVPTKNREDYLIDLIRIVHGFSRQDVELVIEDNSDQNNKVISFLSSICDNRIIYHYDNSSISVVENSDRAIMHSNGKYVCFMGDDDLLSERACEFVDYMDKYKCDSAFFQVAKYYWPGTEFKAHKFPNLIIRDYRSKIKHIDVNDELYNLLRTGATSLNSMPKVYHGIVLRECLDKIFEMTGTYFPGPSPDMANSVALALVVKNHIYCDVPFISSGTSPKSTAGLGAKHKHEGNLKEMDFLPKDVEEKWEIDIPKVWTGATIYAQSALLALRNMHREDLIKRFNYNYHYAYFMVFCSSYSKYFKSIKNSLSKYNQFDYIIAYCCVFSIRVKEFIKNIMLTKFKIGGMLFSDIKNTLDAEKIIDNMIEDISIESIFKLR